jgi:hypothetical protein
MELAIVFVSAVLAIEPCTFSMLGKHSPLSPLERAVAWNKA